MLTGTRPFDGDHITEVLGAVVRLEPDYARLDPAAPPILVSFIRACLVKDPTQRIASLSTFRFVVGQLAATTSNTAPPNRRVARIAVTVGIPLAALALAAAVLSSRGGGAASGMSTPVRLAIASSSQRITTANRQMLGLSRDGALLGYVADDRIYVRPLAEWTASSVSGTESTVAGSTSVGVAFSPDGRELAYISGTSVRKVAVTGGTPVTLATLIASDGDVSNLEWSDRFVYWSHSRAMYRVDQNGGTPEKIVSAAPDELVGWVQPLPDGQHVLFNRYPNTRNGNAITDRWDAADVVVQSISTRERTVLPLKGADPRYLRTGHLAYAVGSVLFAVGFDPSTLTLTGAPVPVVSDVRRSVTGATGVAHFATSDSGHLVYVPGSGEAAAGLVLGLADRRGNVERLAVPSSLYAAPRVSPSGRVAVADATKGSDTDLWLVDLAGRSEMRRLTFGGRNRYPVWSPDGRRVVYSYQRGDAAGLYVLPIDGGAPQQLTVSQAGEEHRPDSWSPDGSVVTFTAYHDEDSSADLRLVHVSTGQITTLAHAPGRFIGKSVFSPDGRWLAYSTTETGTQEVVVQPYPPTGAKYQVGSASNNRSNPWFSPDGRELFFNEGASRWFAVSLTPGPQPTFGTPKEFPRGSARGFGSFEPRPYDMARDGRILAIYPAAGDISNSIEFRVVLNWFDELRQKVSGR
jgi:serine/threonine-protein kinase